MAGSTGISIAERQQGIFSQHFKIKEQKGEIVMKTIKQTSVGSHLDTRLAAYAAAGIAIAAPALAPSAKAAVVYSGPLTLAVPQNIDGIYLDLATGQTGTAFFTGYDINPYAGTSATTLVLGAGTGTAYVAPTTAGPASALLPGAFIGSTDAFATSSLSTNFRATGTEFLGLRFTNTTTSAVNYGWIQFQTSATLGFPATILGYAYENTGIGLLAGQTSGPGVAVPEPTTDAALGLGALALGAVGVRRMRKNKQAVA